MPTIGHRCHELRIPDQRTGKEWRIIYRVDTDAIVIAYAFGKKSRSAPRAAITRRHSQVSRTNHRSLGLRVA